MVWLTVTNNGCTSTDQLLIAVSDNPVYCGTAISNPNNNGQQMGFASNKLGDALFQVYPNPARDRITVEWDTEVGTDVQVEILSMEGKILSSEKADGTAFMYNADLKHLNAGLYMVRLRHSDGKQEVFKLVKQ